MDQKITKLATAMVDRIQSVIRLTETQIGELIGVSQSTIAKWKKRHRGQQTLPSRSHFKALVQLYRVARQVELGAILDCQDSKTGLILKVQHFAHACNYSEAYPSDNHSVAYRDLKRAAAMTDQDWRVQIRVVPLPAKVGARVYVVPVDQPSHFLILLNESLDVEGRRAVLMKEIFAHVSNRIGGASAGAGYENSTPDYAR